MPDAFYKNLHEKMDNERARRILSISDRAVTGYVFRSFPVFLLWLLSTGNDAFLKTALTTAVSFVILSLCRRVINRRRPYEKYGFTPVLEKDSSGKSFPSRHVFSAFLIGTASLPVMPVYACSVFICAFLIMIIRVAGSVHFVSDVIAGAVIGILSGLIVYL